MFAAKDIHNNVRGPSKDRDFCEIMEAYTVLEFVIYKYLTHVVFKQDVLFKHGKVFFSLIRVESTHLTVLK